MSKRDYYEILGLAKNSSADEIKKAYRQLASKFHPDKISGEDNSPEKRQAEEKFKEAKEAYEILSDTEKRSVYDAHGHVDPNSFGNGQQWAHQTAGGANSLDEMFKAFFSQTHGHFNTGSFHQQPRQQVIHVVNISLADAYTGKTLTIDNTSTVIIPPGARSGTTFYVNNKLYRIDIQQHYKFKRSNDDLLVDISISAIEAALGVDVVLDHLDGNKLQFSIPPGIQVGQIVKLSNKGMKNPETDRHGDIMVRISVTVPKSLTEAERTALKVLSHRDIINI